MKNVAGYYDDVRLDGDHRVYRLAKCPRYICFTLVDSRRRLSLVVPEAKMKVGEMNKFH